MNRTFDISEMSDDGLWALKMNIRFALKAMKDEDYRKIHNAYARKINRKPIFSNKMKKRERQELLETHNVSPLYSPTDKWYMETSGYLHSGNDIRRLSTIKLDDLLYDAILSDTTAKTWGNKDIEEAITRTMAWDERHKEKGEKSCF